MTSPARPILRIFLSSPADVGPERDAAELVVRTLARELVDRVDLRLVRWENLERRADQGGFQDGIDQVARVEDCQLLIGILWTRLGVPLGADAVARLPWPVLNERLGEWSPELPVTGTAYEWLSALAHVPAVEVKLFRKTAKPPALDQDDEREVEQALQQRRLAKTFWERLVRQADGSFRYAHQTFATTAAFARDLEQELRLWLRRHLQLPGEADAAIVTWRQGSPWRGLGVFQAEHAPVFFGRDQARQAVLEVLRDEDRKPGGRTFALVVGLSGSGKSSLVRAGVLPHLPGSDPRAGADQERPIRWRTAGVLPGDPGAKGDPTLALVQALLGQALPGWTHGQGDAAGLAARSAAAPDLLVALLQARLAQEPGLRLALLIDQLEELVTAVPRPEDRAGFVRLLDALAAAGIWVIATLRGDYYQAVLEIPGLAALKAGRSLDLLAPTTTEVAEIILRPAQAAGLRFEHRDGRWLNQVIAAEFLAHGTSLPLLSFVLDRLYQLDVAGNTSGAQRGVLEFIEYEQLGRLGGCIAGHVAASLTGLDPALVRRVFPALVRVPPDEAARPVRRRTPVADLPDDPGIRTVIDRLVAARLVDRDGGEGRDASITLAHEILLLPESAGQQAAWPELATWTSEQKHRLRQRDRLTAQAVEWQHAGADAEAASLLLGDGLPILDAERVVAELVVDQTTRNFVSASRQHLERAKAAGEALRRRRQRTAYAIAAGGVVLAGLATAGGVVAWQERARAEAGERVARAAQGDAERQRGIAEAQKKEAEEQRRVADEQRKLAEAQRLQAEADRAKAEASDAAAQKSAASAQRELESAEELTRFMIFDLRDSLEPIGRLDILVPLAEKALAHYRARPEAERSDKEWRSMAVALVNFGDLQQTRGKMNEAKQLYAESLAIAERLTAATPDDQSRQMDLAIAHERLGDMYRAQDDLEAALKEFQASQTVWEKLAAAHPDDPDYRRGLTVPMQRIGDLCNAKGDKAGARAAFLQNLEAARALDAKYPDNPVYQRGLTIPLERLGDLLLGEKDYTGALKYYADSQVIAERLAAQHPDNLQFARDLAFTRQGIADIRFEQEDFPGALADYQATQAILERLAAKDQANTKWQRDLVINLRRLANVAGKQNDPVGKRRLLERAFNIIAPLAKANPDAKRFQEDVTAIQNAYATVDGPAERLAARRADLRDAPEDPAALNAVAWELLTSDDAALRQPAEALPLAEKAVALGKRETPTILDTLAVALGELGRWDEAVACEAEALGRLPADTSAETRAAFQTTLDRLKARKRLDLPKPPAAETPATPPP